MEQNTVRRGSWRVGFEWIMCAGLLLGSLALFFSDVQATTIYSYIDEQGNPRFSDSMDNIPEKYRAKVKTHEQTTPQERPPTVLDSARAMVPTSAIASFKQKVIELLQGFGIPVSSASGKTGTTPSPASPTTTNRSPSGYGLPSARTESWAMSVIESEASLSGTTPSRSNSITA